MPSPGEIHPQAKPRCLQCEHSSFVGRSGSAVPGGGGSHLTLYSPDQDEFKLEIAQPTFVLDKLDASKISLNLANDELSAPSHDSDPSRDQLQAR